MRHLIVLAVVVLSPYTYDLRAAEPFERTAAGVSATAESAPAAADVFGPTPKADTELVADPGLAWALLGDPNLIANAETAVLFAPGATVTAATVAAAPAGTRLDVVVPPSTRWLRVVAGAGAGQVAAVTTVATDHVRIGRVFDLPQRFVASDGRPGWLDVLAGETPSRTGDAPWFRAPAAGDRVVAASSTLMVGETPAFVTVAEVRGDERLRVLNLERVQPRIDALKAARTGVLLAVPVLFTERGGRIVTLTPDLTEAEVSGTRLRLPRPWGPRGPGDRDLFEDATLEALAGAEIEATFVDSRSRDAAAPWWTRLAP